ncbi:MAG: cupin domain-containing protein [Actinomycetes bacterium]|jgi:uncharacterized protein
MSALNLDGLSAEEVIERFALLPLEGEGGFFSLVQRDEHGNAIYFLMTPGQFSAWHRLKERETWVLIGGSPLALHIKEESYERVELSRTGELSASVAPGEWMAAETLGEWSLVLCFLAPPFSEMELAPRHLVDAWIKDFPQLPRLVHE